MLKNNLTGFEIFAQEFIKTTKVEILIAHRNLQFCIIAGFGYTGAISKNRNFPGWRKKYNKSKNVTLFLLHPDAKAAIFFRRGSDQAKPPSNEA